MLQHRHCHTREAPRLCLVSHVLVISDLLKYCNRELCVVSDHINVYHGTFQLRVVCGYQPSITSVKFNALQASGFCYVNGIVLAILQLLK